MTDPINKKIKEIVEGNPVVIFMKGTPEAPRCGFSAQALKCLEKAGAKPLAVDILSDPGLRQGIKDFTKWPTVPQIFIGGQFVGGCDIVSEMSDRGELEGAVTAAFKK